MKKNLSLKKNNTKSKASQVFSSTLQNSPVFDRNFPRVHLFETRHRLLLYWVRPFPPPNKTLAAEPGFGSKVRFLLFSQQVNDFSLFPDTHNPISHF